MNRQMIAKELLKVAREVLEMNEQEKGEELFFETMLAGITRLNMSVHFIISPNVAPQSIAAAKKPQEPADQTELLNVFNNVMNTSPSWENKNRTAPFYPRDVVKRALQKNLSIIEVKRETVTISDDKIGIQRYGFKTFEDIRKLLIQRIDSDDEHNGLKYTPHIPVFVKPESDEMKKKGKIKGPADLYTTILRVKKGQPAGQNERVYVKFRIDKDIYLDLYFALYSFHPDLNQNNV